jgi:hypothetical protein
LAAGPEGLDDERAAHKELARLSKGAPHPALGGPFGPGVATLEPLNAGTVRLPFANVTG